MYSEEEYLYITKKTNALKNTVTGLSIDRQSGGGGGRLDRPSDYAQAVLSNKYPGSCTKNTSSIVRP